MRLPLYEKQSVLDENLSFGVLICQLATQLNSWSVQKPPEEAAGSYFEIYTFREDV